MAGGIGITPIRALVEEMAGDVVVVYRVLRADDAVLYDELERLADRARVPSRARRRRPRDRGGHAPCSRRRICSSSSPTRPSARCTSAARPRWRPRSSRACGPWASPAGSSTSRSSPSDDPTERSSMRRHVHCRGDRRSRWRHRRRCRRGRPGRPDDDGEEEGRDDEARRRRSSRPTAGAPCR